MTSLCEFCLLLDSLSAILVIKTFASLSSFPSTASTKGENDTCLACAAHCIFSSSPSHDQQMPILPSQIVGHVIGCQCQ